MLEWLISAYRNSNTFRRVSNTIRNLHWSGPAMNILDLYMQMLYNKQMVSADSINQRPIYGYTLIVFAKVWYFWI